jgi:O-antigen ligase
MKSTFHLILWASVCLLVGIALGRYADSPILILILLAIAGALVFVAIDFALYLMLACLPFSFRFILPSKMEVQTPTEPLLGMLVFVFALKRVLARALHMSSRDNAPFPFALPIFVYIVATLLPTFNSPDIFVSAKGAFRSACYMMVSFVAYDLIRSRRDLYCLFISTFPSASVAVVWTVIVLIYHIDQWQWTSAYHGTPFTNYSVYGSFTAFFFLIVLSRLLLDRTQFDRVLWTGMLIVFGVGLLMCFSRGVWLSVIVAIGFLLLHAGTGEQHKRILLMGGSLMLVLVFLSLPGISDLIRERISTVFNLQFASNRARLLRWGQALAMFLQQPIIGNGYGAFAILYEEDASLVGEYTAQFQLGAHSEYLQTLAELGIVGFIAWMWTIFVFFRYGWRALKRITDTFYRSIIIGLMGGELALLVHLVVNNLLNGDAIGIPFWLIYGLLPAVARMAETGTAHLKPS